MAVCAWQHTVRDAVSRSLLMHRSLASVATTAPSTSRLALPNQEPVYIPLCQLIPTPNIPNAAEERIVALDRSVFACPLRRDILHLCINYYRDAMRQGTASTKTRGEVAGSGRKIRPQKGSGRARLGDGQSPMLRGGGVAFGPKPRDFSTKLPRKVREMGMRVALSAKIREKALAVVDSLDWRGAKTSGFEKRMTALGMDRALLVTGSTIPERLERVSRNIPSLLTMQVTDVNVYHLLTNPKLVLDLKAIEFLEEELRKPVNITLEEEHDVGPESEAVRL